MDSLTLAQKGSPLPYIAGALAEHANESAPGAYAVSWQEGSSLKEKDKKANAILKKDGQETVGEPAVVSEILSASGSALGHDAEEVAQWVAFAQGRLAVTNFKELDAALSELDHRLVMRSFVAGYKLTAADLAAWGALKASAIFQRNLKTKPEFLGDHLVRWYSHVNSLPFADRLAESLSQSQKQQTSKAADQGSFELGLQGVEHGKVVTRFPPEPSGYLHIGHAKAALLNEFIARSNGGKLIIRFDDTNPSKEKEEFESSIVEDLRLLGIKGDTVSHTSDYFDTIYEYALTLIKKGLAYVDDTDQETMRQERMDGIASKCRDLSVEDNLARFQQLMDATEFGQTCCLRAKMSVDSKNKAMRDPVIFRCNLTPHHRTGTKWKAYPTYDFCCPIVDSIEGVTHALRSMEYRDRNPQYDWFFPALDLRPVQIMDFSRMNFVYTLLSKRKLQWFVDNKLVGGWDDPRFPTVRGIRRRGMTIEALRQYVLMQGASQKNMLLEWDKIWSLNKKIVDPVAPRHTALLKKELVPATVLGGPEKPYVKEVPKHKKNPELGTKNTVFSSQLFIDQADAQSFEKGEEVTLMDWGNAFVDDIQKSAEGVVTGLALRLHLEGDVKATKKKITWLGQDPEIHPVEALLLDYDYLITKKKLEEDDSVEDVLTPTTEFSDAAMVDANVAQLKQGDIIQLERRGYYIVDKVAGESELGLVTLISIPDGKASTLASKHKDAPSTEKAEGKQKKEKSAAKGSPWAKGNMSKGAKQEVKAQKSADESLGLPRPKDIVTMYETKPVYGDVPLDEPKKISSINVLLRRCLRGHGLWRANSHEAGAADIFGRDRLRVAQVGVSDREGEVDDDADADPDRHPQDVLAAGEDKQQDADDAAQDGQDWHLHNRQGHVESAGSMRLSESEDDDADVDEEVRKQGGQRCQVAEDVDREEGSNDGSDDSADQLAVDGRLEPRAERAHGLGEEPVAADGHPDARLDHLQHHGDRRQTGNRADSHQDAQPPGARVCLERSCRGRRCVEVCVLGQASQHNDHGPVEHGAHEQGDHNADGQVALRALGLLRGAGQGVKSDEGEEELLGTLEDAYGAKGAALLRRHEGSVVVAVDVLDRRKDEHEDDNDLDHSHHVVDHLALGDADAQDGHGGKDDEHCGDVDDGAAVHLERAVVRVPVHRRHRGLLREGDVERILEEPDDVARPPDGNSCAPDEPLERHHPADQECEELAHGGVHERHGDHQRGSRKHGGGSARDHEDTAADDHTQTHEAEIEGAQGALELGLLAVQLLEHHLDGLLPAHGSEHALPAWRRRSRWCVGHFCCEIM
ncbi:glutamyl-tRNA synthetase [Martensiomyces pterosporus]|nr:glutamyl-tRNA synthetase [Martensiomyces pterosporus]